MTAVRTGASGGTQLQVLPLPAELPGARIPAPVPPSEVWWSVPLPAAPMISPAIGPAHVFAIRLPGILGAYRLSDGREIWTSPLVPDQPLSVDPAHVFVASGEAIHALRAADGRVVWRTPVGAVSAPLLVTEGWVIAASGRRLHALRAADGTPVWSVDGEPQRERAAIAGDILFRPLASGAIEARDLSTGAVRWHHALGAAPAEPLVADDRVFFGASDQHFYCLDAGSGEVEWKWAARATLLGRAATDGSRVYFAALDNLIRALDLRRGWLRWHKGVPFRPLSGPVVAGSSLLVAGTPQLRLLNLATGETAGSLALPQKLAVGPAVATVNGTTVVAAVTGGLEESWRISVAAVPAATIARPSR